MFNLHVLYETYYFVNDMTPYVNIDNPIIFKVNNRKYIVI